MLVKGTYCATHRVADQIDLPELMYDTMRVRVVCVSCDLDQIATIILMGGKIDYVGSIYHYFNLSCDAARSGAAQS